MLVSVKKAILELRTKATPIAREEVKVGDWISVDYISSKGPIVKGRIGVVEEVRHDQELMKLDCGDEGFRSFKFDKISGDILLIPKK